MVLDAVQGREDSLKNLESLKIVVERVVSRVFDADS